MIRRRPPSLRYLMLVGVPAIALLVFAVSERWWLALLIAVLLWLRIAWVDGRARLWLSARVARAGSATDMPDVDPVVEELKSLYAAAMGQDRSTYDALASSDTLQGPQFAKDQGRLQLMIMYEAMQHVSFAHRTQDERQKLVDRAIGTPCVFSTLVERHIASRVLQLDATNTPPQIAEIQDNVEWSGRFMPTVIGLTAFLLSRATPAAKPWPQLVDQAASNYKRYIQSRIKR